MNELAIVIGVAVIVGLLLLAFYVLVWPMIEDYAKNHDEEAREMGQEDDI